MIFLQETYSDKNIENLWRAEWGGDVLSSRGSKHSRGVMVLFKPTLIIENPEIVLDKSGRFLLARTTILDEEFFSPIFTRQTTQVFKNLFFNELSNKLRLYSSDNFILGGDLNCPLESVDK